MTSGVTLLWVPVGKVCLDAPLFKSKTEALARRAKMEAREVHEPHGVGSRGPLKGPGGVQGQSPWWGSRGRSPRKLPCFFNAETAFSKQNNILFSIKCKAILQKKMRQ